MIELSGMNMLSLGEWRGGGDNLEKLETGDWILIEFDI